MKFKLYKAIVLTLPLLFLFLLPPQAKASEDFTVSPLIIDITANPRESFERTITIENKHTNSLRLFASVNEITIGDDSEIKTFVPSSMSDRTTSVTSWIEITRGRLDIKSGEKMEVPLVVRINPNTPPGLYHAFVGFASATNRDIAEGKVLAGESTGVVLRISIGGKQQEFLRLVSFTTSRFSFSNKTGNLTYVLENTGDTLLSPKGDVIIYDSRGKELTSVEFASETDDIIQPGETIEYKKDLPFTNRLGKNKAYLSVEYGSKSKAALYDTNFYYSIPWLYVIIIVLLLTLVLVTIVFLLRRGINTVDIHETNEAYDVPLFVRDNKSHDNYDHDIDLKKKN